MRVPGRRVPVPERAAPEILRRVAATRRVARPASGPRGLAAPVREPARQPRAITARRPVLSPRASRRPRRPRQRSELPRPVARRPGVVAPAGPGARGRRKRLPATQVPVRWLPATQVAPMQVAATVADRMRPTGLTAQPQRRPGRPRRRPSSRRSSSSSPRISPQPGRQSLPPSRNGSRRPGQGPMTTQRTAVAAMTARRAPQAGADAVAAADEARALAPTRAPGLMAPSSRARRTRDLTKPARTPANPTRMAQARRLARRSVVAVVAALARAPKPTLTRSRLAPTIRRTPSSTSGHRARRAPTSTMCGP